MTAQTITLSTFAHGTMTARDLFLGSASATIARGLESTETLIRVKAESARRVVARIESGDLPASDADLAAALERMYRVVGNADRSVQSLELEVIQGLAFRLAR